MSDRPLSGVRVLDFGHYLAGPLVGMMLADMGAEVIRIDPPEGPRNWSPAAEMLSRGKRSLVIDLKTDDGVAEVIELSRRSDVVIENFRPGVMDRLGVGPDVLRAANESLVYLSLPGFASTDPEHSQIAAWEAVIAAATGQFTDMGLNRRLMGINPSFTPLGLASAYGSAFGAMSVLFALNAREQLGGDHIEVPLASALVEGLAYNLMQIEDYPDRYKSPRELELDRREAISDHTPLSYDQLSEFLDPFYRTYTCADGRGFYVVAGSVATHPRRVLAALGLDHLAEQLPDFDPYLDTADWPDEWSLRNYPVGPSDRHRISAAMKEAFLSESSAHWEEVFGEAKAPATAQRWTSEWLTDPHATSSGLILTVLDTPYGPMQQMGNIAWLADDESAMHKDSGPISDDARPTIETILGEAPRAQPSGQRAQPLAGWLDGLRVLDLTNVIAGPTIGSTLARFGAEVTLLQPVTPTVDPWNTVVFGIQAQQGKRSILADLRTEEGRKILDDLIVRSDVITFNGTDEQRDKLGLSEARLSDVNPKAVLVQLDAFGGPHQGPKSNHLGYDDLAQAATGVMLRFGGSMATPEEHAHFGTIDALTGYCACVALGAALLRRRRTGHSSVARASLAAAGNLIQAEFMYSHADRRPFDEPSGRDVKGAGPLYHCYLAADGWIFFAAPTQGASALRSIPEFADIGSLPDDAMREVLAERFAQRPMAHWSEATAGSSAAAVPLGTLIRTRDSSLQLSTSEIDLDTATFRSIRYVDHPMGRWCDLVAPNAVRSRNSQVTIPSPAPHYGHDARNILIELGYDPAQIEQLISSRAVADRWSSRYLPL